MPDRCEDCDIEVYRCLSCDKVLCDICMMNEHGCVDEEEDE